MAAAELTTESIESQGPLLAKKFYFFTGTSAANNDFVTFSGLTTIKGAYCIATDGTVGEMTFATNVLTITNGSTKTWNGYVWGV